MNKIFWIAGEKSGDLHASLVINQLNMQLSDCYNFGIGGDKMEAKGFKSIFPFAKFNVMGFAEVLKHLFFFVNIEYKIKKILKKEQPDLVVLVDYPGLNLRIAKIAKKMKIKVLYYICPQFWAWKHKRVYKIKKYCDFVCCINPFESHLLDKFSIDNMYVGHPVAEEISSKYDKETFKRKFSIPENKKIVGLFPGSRKMELENHLPIFYELINNNKDTYFILSISDKNFNEYFHSFSGFHNVTLINGNNYEIMKHADYCIAKSGTTTLELALFTTPFTIIYKANPFSVYIAKKIAKVKYIGLPNLIADKMVVKEFIQETVNLENLENEMNNYLNNFEENRLLVKELSKISHLLGDSSASKNVANKILSMLES